MIVSCSCSSGHLQNQFCISFLGGGYIEVPENSLSRSGSASGSRKAVPENSLSRSGSASGSRKAVLAVSVFGPCSVTGPSSCKGSHGT